ncbi:MAG: hypothetical protein ACSHYC_04490 [Alphaproteobacteria bacterium]
MRLFIKTLLLAGLFSSIAGIANANTRLLVNCFWPPQHYVCQSVLPTWLAEVEEATEGRVRGIIPPKSVAAPPEQLNSVEKGIADVAPQFNGLIQGRVTGPLVAMNPFIATTDAPAMSEALWETRNKFFPDEFDSVHLLSMWVITPAELYSQTDEPLNSMEDLVSRKIWALPGALAATMKKVGAGVVSGPAVQANEIISRGVVDAHIGLSPTAVRDFRVIPYTKSMTRFNDAIYSTSFSLIINKDKWMEISEEDRAAITELSGVKFARMAAQHWMEADQTALEEFKEAEIEIIEADPAFEAALREASGFVAENWIAKANEAGIDGQGAYDYYVKRVQELSK